MLFSHSANIYLDYLENRKPLGGRKVVSITWIQQQADPSVFLLEAAEKIRLSSDWEVWVRGQHIESIKILTIGSPEHGPCILRLSDDGHYLRSLTDLLPTDIQVVSDLRFLIKRLDRFYSTRSFSFLPPPPPSLPELPPEYIQGLSHEQLSAIENVFSSPVSYISGAPGTGKTRMVLSRCVLRYVLSGKRVILLAPTNNAVEQMLRSVLPVLKESRIPLEKVYRLGTSSSTFAREYPQVVGDTVLDTLVENLNEEKMRINSRLSDAQKEMSSLQAEIRNLSKIHRTHDTLMDLFPQLLDLQDRLSIAVSDEAQAAQALKDLKAQSGAARSSEAKIMAKIQDKERLATTIHNQANTFTYRTFRRKRRDQLMVQLSALSEELEQLRLDRTAASLKVQELTASIQEAGVLYKTKYTLTNQLKRQCEAELPKRILSAAKGCPHCSVLVPSILESSELHILPLSEHFDSWKKEDRSNEQQKLQCIIDKLQEELNEVISRLSDVSGTAKMQQKDSALVLCGTVDTSLPHLSPPESANKISVSHVFLDEAGYTSLARGIAAFSCNAPVTFLGDHKQLPPVCEMNRIREHEAPVCLWSLSVAYFSELIYGTIWDLYYTNYCKTTEPSFNQVSYSSLNTSYRFGPLLADILARHIYSGDFHGNPRSTFEILILDSPHAQGPLPRSSLSEAENILNYLRTNPSNDVAILAPYQNQVKLLRNTLPPQYKGSVLTVHRSQGQEWEDVILSVTDTVDPYFTDSDLSIGRSILCTALSRTKHRLILACDVSVWSRSPNQIITELIRLGQSRTAPKSTKESSGDKP